MDRWKPTITHADDLDTAIFESRHGFFRRAIGLIPQNGVEVVFVDPGEKSPFLAFAPVVKYGRNRKTPSAKFAPCANEKRAAILKRNEGRYKRWHSNKAPHAQM